MKKNIFVLTSLMLTLGCGCDSFLDETNYSDVTSEGGYYDTEAGLNAVVNGLLYSLRFWRERGCDWLSETGNLILLRLVRDAWNNNMAAYTQVFGWNKFCLFPYKRWNGIMCSMRNAQKG